MSRRFVVFLISFLSGMDGSAQVKSIHLRRQWLNTNLPDSIRYKSLDSFYELNEQAYPDTALNSINYHLNLARQRGDKLQECYAEIKKGNILRLQRRFESALLAYTTAERLSLTIKNPMLTANIKFNTANVFANQADYVSATRNYYEAMEIYEQIHNYRGIYKVKIALGNVFSIIRKFDLALDLYEEVNEQIRDSVGVDRSKAIILVNSGWCYYGLEQYQKAKDLYIKGLSIFESIDDDFYVSDGYCDLARINLKLNDLNNALIFAKKSIELNKKLNNHEAWLESIVVQAQIEYFANPSKALKDVQLIYGNVLTLKNLQLKYDITHLMYRCYQSMNDFKTALLMFEKSSKYQDSLNREIFQYQILQEAIQRQHDSYVAKLEASSKVKQSQLKIQQLKILLVIGFFLLVLVVGITYRFNRLKVKNELKRQQLLQEIDRLKTVNSTVMPRVSEFQLNREKIEQCIARKLNETDWRVLTILLVQPTISNKELAEQAFLSVDGIGSSLRRMYDIFEVGNSKYKKIALITVAIKYSNS